MKIFKLNYYANHYANGGNWTHIIKVYDEEDRNNEPIKLEEDTALSIKKKMDPYLSGNNLLSLANSMKWRQDFQCSLLLSKSECDYLKSKEEMQTYSYRH